MRPMPMLSQAYNADEKIDRWNYDRVTGVQLQREGSHCKRSWEPHEGTATRLSDR